MGRSAIRIVGTFLSVVIFVASCTSGAKAGWESGLNVTPQISAQNEKVKADDAKSVFADKVLSLVNDEREKAGLIPLVSSEALSEAADTRASEAAVLFSHIRPDGRSCATVFSDNKLVYFFAGENLAFGYNKPEELVAAWMNSKGHRQNNLNKNFVYAKIGCYTDNNGVIYCSMLFYTPQPHK